MFLFERVVIGFINPLIRKASANDSLLLIARYKLHPFVILSVNSSDALGERSDCIVVRLHTNNIRKAKSEIKFLNAFLVDTIIKWRFFLFNNLFYFRPQLHHVCYHIPISPRVNVCPEKYHSNTMLPK